MSVAVFIWIPIVGGIVCFIMAYGIGANDVANSFSTAVGSKAITLKQAVIIASIFEFLGAIMGAPVANTIKSGITNFDDFQTNGDPYILMIGMFCALLSAAMWLLLATSYSLPVSTTHSILGGIIGFVLVSKGVNAIHWYKIIIIIVFWILTPLIAAIIVNILFRMTRYIFLRKNNSYKLVLRYWWVFIWICLFIGLVYTSQKGLKRFNLKIFKDWHFLVFSFFISFILSWIIQCLVVNTGYLNRICENKCKEEWFQDMGIQNYQITKTTDDNEKPTKPSPKNDENDENDEASEFIGDGIETTTIKDNINKDDNNEKDIELNDIENDTNNKNNEKSIGDKSSTGSAPVITTSGIGINKNIHDGLTENESKLHNECEKFDLKTEATFVLLQVVSACLCIFAQGSNDVANAVAPFSAIYSIYKTDKAEKDVEIQVWILIIGGFGMTLGLATYGHKILKVLGVQLATMTCTRGFCIVLSSAITVLIGSYFGLPTSTTHAQVGAVAGCGLCEVGNKYSNLTIKTSINWKLLLKIAIGWILTLIISALTSAMLFSMLIFSPVDQGVCQNQYVF